MKLWHAAVIVYALFAAFFWWIAIDPAFPFGFRTYATFALYAMLALAAIVGVFAAVIAAVGAFTAPPKRKWP